MPVAPTVPPTAAPPLQPGDSLPHFVLSCPDGSVWDYGVTTWQRRNLLLLALPAHTDVAATIYVDTLLTYAQDLRDYDTTWVMTRLPIAGMPAPGVLIADRWGEIHLVAGAAAVGELPPASGLLECLRALAYACPECQGEAR